MIVRSPRNKYIAAHVKPGIKEQLKVEADALNISLSKHVSDVLEAWLKSKTFKRWKANESTSD